MSYFSPNDTKKKKTQETNRNKSSSQTKKKHYSIDRWIAISCLRHCHRVLRPLQICYGEPNRNLPTVTRKMQRKDRQSA